MSGLYDFPEPLRRKAEAALLDGERVVWAGRPDPARAARATWPVVLFGIPWAAVSGLFMLSPIVTALGVADIKGAAGWAGVGIFLFSIPFVAIGVALVGAPVWAFREAVRSGFLVTDKRVLRVTEGTTGGVRWFAGRSLRGAEASVHADGRGTVKALGPIGRDSDGDRKTDDLLMIGVADPAGAERSLMSLVETSR